MQEQSEPLLSFFEPWFFVQRHRTFWKWLPTLAVPTVIFALCLAYVSFAGKELWWAIVGGVVGCTIFLVQWEYPCARRVVALFGDSLVAVGHLNELHTREFCPLGGIQSLEIIRSSPGKYATLVVTLENRKIQMGIEVAGEYEHSLVSLAQILTILGVPVHMLKWSPADFFAEAIERHASDLPPATLVTPAFSSGRSLAVVKEIPPQQQSLTPPMDTAIARITAHASMWLLNATVAATCLGYAYLCFIEPALLRKEIIFVLMIAMIFLGGVACDFHLRFGVALANRRVRRIAQAQVMRRGESLIRQFDDSVFLVDVLDPSYVHIYSAKEKDAGFIAVDNRKQCIVFEGEKERWTIPFDSVETCEIDRLTTEHKGQAGPVRCFVNLTFECADGARSVALRIPNQHLGHYTDELRLKHAQELYAVLCAPLNEPAFSFCP